MPFFTAQFAQRARHSGSSTILVAAVIAMFLTACQESADSNIDTAPSSTDAAQPIEPSTSAEAKPGKLLWGDLHVHSNLSFDAFSFGNRNLTPSDTFAFAKGEALQSSGGIEAKLARPLDFLMVSDHAEFMGVMRELIGNNEALMEAEPAQRWRQLLAENRFAEVIGDFVGSISRTVNYSDSIPVDFTRDIWSQVNAAAEEHNNPGTFTALIGYEWTSM
ncbi:MAG: DUF3604 domain-containing protein, partial [Halieaceae bacterium]